MNSEDPVSIEQINAYVDNQLSDEVKAEILKKSQQNEELAETICQTRIIKEMVKFSYQRPPDNQLDKRSEKHSAKHKPGLFQYGIAASLFILLGGLAGWNGAYFYSASELNETLSQQVQLTPEAIDNHRVLLHISTDEPSKVEAALNNAERLLSRNNSDEKFKLQILVNAEGIKILQKNESPYIERIRALAMHHENISFLACQRSIERQKLKGIDIHLINEVSVIPEALAEIVQRLNQGWIYIRA